MLARSNYSKNYKYISARPISAALGAYIDHIDLVNLDADTFTELSHALYQHGVLVIKNANLDHSTQNELTLRFGEHAEDAYTQGVEGYPGVQPVITEAGAKEAYFFGQGWHTDSPFLERPPSISLLRSVEVPPFGGDTTYASMVQAYAALSDGMKDILAPLKGLYTRAHMMRARKVFDENPEVTYDAIATEADLAVATRHPIVRTHPETGEKALYMDGLYLNGIDGLSREEAAPMLSYLTQHMTKSEFQCRISWEPDMLLMWDNRLVIHQAFRDYRERREMYRSTVQGEVPS